MLISTYLNFSGCTLLQLPLPAPPSQTPLPQPPIEPEKPQPQAQTEKRPPIFRDPDGLSPIFAKESSTVYLNTYAGVARAGAKTSVAEEPTKYFDTVGDVLKNLPTDSYMRRQGLGDNSPRSVDENLNVFIKKPLFSLFLKRKTKIFTSLSAIWQVMAYQKKFDDRRDFRLTQRPKLPQLFPA
ncbi:MAG: hypothetical protein HC817_02305 [Saprospiraceae bacterium]|nr:hypothetical protein [Saprospiraceae bacterium]